MDVGAQQETPTVGRALKQHEQPKPSPWAEIGIEEKIERLREALMRLRWGANNQSSTLSYLTEQIDRLGDHSHDPQGRTVVPFRHHYGTAGMAKEAAAHDPLA